MKRETMSEDENNKGTHKYTCAFSGEVWEALKNYKAEVGLSFIQQLERAVPLFHAQQNFPFKEEDKETINKVKNKKVKKSSKRK